MSTPLPLHSTAQRLDQHCLQSIFAFLTLHELAVVSTSCQLWRSDVLRLKSRSLELDLKVDERIEETVQNLILSPLRHHIGSIVLVDESRSLSVPAQLIQSLPQLHTLPSLSAMTLNFIASDAALAVAKEIDRSQQKTKRMYEDETNDSEEASKSSLSFFSSSLIHLNIQIGGESRLIVSLMQLFIESISQLSSLRSLVLINAVDLNTIVFPLNFASLLGLSSSLIEFTLTAQLPDSGVDNICYVLKQMNAIKSICIDSRPSSRHALKLLLTDPHSLQQLERLEGQLFQVKDDDLPFLTSTNVPSLTHLSALQLDIRSLDSIITLIALTPSMSVKRIVCDLNGASLMEDQSDAFFIRFPQLQELLLTDTSLPSLRCFRFMHQLTVLSLVRSSQHLQSDDIKYVYALPLLRSLQIVESHSILLTVESMAELQVPSKRILTLRYIMLNPGRSSSL